MILVTGATGNIGRELVAELGKRGVPFRAMLRNVNKRTVLPAAADIIQGDFARPDTLPAALDGVDHVFLLSPSSEKSAELEINFIETAKQAGVAHIVKISVLGADLHSTCRFLRFHREVELELEHSGIGWTNLRPNLFMQMTFAYASTIAAQDAIFGLAGDSRISMVDVRDVAAVAAVALTEPGHEKQHYDITGPEVLTYTEVAEHLSAAIGKQVRYVNVPASVSKEGMIQKGIPAWQIDGILELYELYKRGDAAQVTDTVRTVAKREPIAFAQFARDFAQAFTAAAPNLSASVAVGR